MGQAEYAGLGSLATGLAAGVEGEQERRQREKYRKRQDWLQCIMSGDSAETCAQVTGYQPEPQESAGATRFQSEAETRKKAGEERTAIGKLSLEEYKTAHTRPIPGQDITMRSRLPSGETVSTVMGETKEKEIYLPDLGPRKDWRGALAGAAEKRKVAKERGRVSEKRAYREFTDAAIIKRKLEERRLGLTKGDKTFEKETKKWLSGREKEEETKRNKVEGYVIKWNKAWTKIQETDPLALKGKTIEYITKFEMKQKSPISAFNQWAKGNVPRRFRNAVREATGLEKKTVTPPTGDLKAGAQGAFDEMKGAGQDKATMLENVNKHRAQLEKDGVDVEELLRLINAQI